jgi:hypothetical protein
LIIAKRFSSVPEYPKEDGKQRASELARRRGGNCPNTLEVLSQLIDSHRALTYDSTEQQSNNFSGSTIQVDSNDNEDLDRDVGIGGLKRIDLKVVEHSSDETASSTKNVKMKSQGIASKDISEPLDYGSINVHKESISLTWHLNLLTMWPLDSDWTAEMMKSLPGVNIVQAGDIPKGAEAPSSYIIRSRQTDSRTIINYNGLPEMTLQDFERVFHDVDDLERGKWWHFEVHNFPLYRTCVQRLALC